MSSTSLDGLNTSIIATSLTKDVGSDLFLPYLPSINTITAYTSNDGNVTTIDAGDHSARNAVAKEIPKYGKLSAAAFEFGHASAQPVIASATLANSRDYLHGAYSLIDSVELRSQGKKLLGWTGAGMHSQLIHNLTRSQYEAISVLAQNNARLSTLLFIPLPSMFDKKLCLDTVYLDRLELVIKMKQYTGHQDASAAGAKLHFWYHQTNPETEAVIRSEMFSRGDRNILMYDCQSYSVVSTDRSVNLTSQKLVRCHYVDEYKEADKKGLSMVNGNNDIASNNAFSQTVSVKAGGRVIYESSKANAVASNLILGKEINNGRTLCIDYRNGVLKSSSADFSSGLALRHLPQPTLSLSAYMTDGTNANDRLEVSEEAYVMLSIKATNGSIVVVAEN